MTIHEKEKSNTKHFDIDITYPTANSKTYLFNNANEVKHINILADVKSMFDVKCIARQKHR